jgi:hypothetical protein
MAFNPFNAFRKHQKVVFAALTIVCMLTFVMAGGSFAGGDFFSEVTRWVTGRSRVQEVATVYGKRISDRELQELRRQRRLANQFIQQAVFSAQENILNIVQGSLPQFDQAIQNQLNTILMRRRYIAFMPRDYLQKEYLNNLGIYLLQLQLMDKQLDKKLEQVQMVRQLQLALQQDFWLFHAPKDDLYPDENLYFGGSTSEQGLLDFLIWRQQADRLGIHLTAEDIGKLYGHETLHSSPEVAQILRALGFQPDNATQQGLVAALGDEFRVRLAQAALVGYDPGGHIDQVPTSITPYEFWDYYQKNRTELSLKLLPIPVQKFIAEIKDRPSEADPQALFDKYKDQEYAPDKDTPGFKQPRRMRLEWISASPDSEYYRKQARAWLLSLVAATPGNALLPIALIDPLVSEYESLKWGTFRAPALTVEDFASSFYDYIYFGRPENVAATVGQFLGTAVVHGSAVAPVVAYQGAAAVRSYKDLAPIVAREAQRRLPFSSAIFSAGSSVQTPFQPALTLAAIWQYASKIDQYLPMDLVRGQLVRKLQENVANTLLTSSLDAFKTELEKLRKELESKKTKPADVEKLVEKAIREHGWAHGSTTQLQDQYEINRESKQLAPLKEAYTRETQFRDPKGRMFAQTLLFSQGLDQWKLFTPRELVSNPSADTTEKKTFLYWKTDDQPAKVLTFAQAKPEVEAAWRLEKARGLAKAKAEDLAKQARDTHGDYLRTLNEASKEYGPVFELNGVSRWAKPALTSRAQPFPQYEPYKVPDDKIEYPPPWPNFVDTLLENLNQSGDTTVISNRPKDIYYVVALARRDVPSVQDFNKETAGNRQLLLRQLEAERQTEYRRAFLQQLRKEARLSVNEDALQRVKERPNLTEE